MICTFKYREKATILRAFEHYHNCHTHTPSAINLSREHFDSLAGASVLSRGRGAPR